MKENSCITKATISRREPLPSERIRLRALQTAQDQRSQRVRREALAILEREDQARDELAFAGTVREDLQATRRRPLDAPMATPDPLAWAPKSYLPDVVPSLGLGRLALALLLMTSSFIAGLVAGKLL